MRLGTCPDCGQLVRLLTDMPDERRACFHCRSVGPIGPYSRLVKCPGSGKFVEARPAPAAPKE